MKPMDNLMKRVMVIDSTGMAGHMISNCFKGLNKYEVIDVVCDSSYSNLMDQQALVRLFERQKPQVVINCARVLIHESEDNPSQAIYVNSYFPHLLERLFKDTSTRIIHLSTDCVFSGQKGDYNENDQPDGENYYARSKALGEIINHKDLTLRTSFIGPNIEGREEELFHWFMMQKGEICGYNRVYWTGITTLELARCTDEAIEQNLTGLYHLVPEKKISKYELLKLMQKSMKKNDLHIKKDEQLVLDKSLIDNRNRIFVKDYQQMFEELSLWMENKALYSGYFECSVE
ncbi:MAG: sugar nucleotide-binding protein [Bacteroidales bacterium]|nr:sugar nucleotide-binding protein [Bacteroidales bacterium]